MPFKITTISKVSLRNVNGVLLDTFLHYMLIWGVKNFYLY